MAEQKRIIKKWTERKNCVKQNVQSALDANDMDALEAAMPPLQFAFCNEYIKDFNGSAACVRAGSTCATPERMAYQWLVNPGVKAVIAHLLEERTQRMKVDQGYVIQKLVRTVEKAEADNNHQSVLRGVELLAKHLGMFSDKIELTGRDGEAIQIEKVQEDAATLSSAIAGLVKRSREAGVDIETKH